LEPRDGCLLNLLPGLGVLVVLRRPLAAGVNLLMAAAGVALAFPLQALWPRWVNLVSVIVWVEIFSLQWVYRSALQAGKLSEKALDRP
jgi:hypothetical protein